MKQLNHLHNSCTFLIKQNIQLYLYLYVNNTSKRKQNTQPKIHREEETICQMEQTLSPKIAIVRQKETVVFFLARQ